MRGPSPRVCPFARKLRDESKVSVPRNAFLHPKTSPNLWLGDVSSASLICTHFYSRPCALHRLTRFRDKMSFYFCSSLFGEKKYRSFGGEYLLAMGCNSVKALRNSNRPANHVLTEVVSFLPSNVRVESRRVSSRMRRACQEQTLEELLQRIVSCQNYRCFGGSDIISVNTSWILDFTALLIMSGGEEELCSAVVERFIRDAKTLVLDFRVAGALARCFPMCFSPRCPVVLAQRRVDGIYVCGGFVVYPKSVDPACIPHLSSGETTVLDPPHTLDIAALCNPPNSLRRLDLAAAQVSGCGSLSAIKCLCNSQHRCDTALTDIDLSGAQRWK